MQNPFLQESDEDLIKKSPHGRPATLLLLLPLLLAQLAAFYFYASGFIGHSPSAANKKTDPAVVPVSPMAPVYDRVVLMLVDALRHDFVTSDNFPYLSK